MHALQRLSPDQLVQRWRELALDPDTPDDFELDEFGEIIVSPAPTNLHECLASQIVIALQAQLGPEATAAISVLTDDGVRRPDATWMPRERWMGKRKLNPLPFAPDICVEVLSAGNTPAEMEKKRVAYLEAGAKEVIFVAMDGTARFFGAEGERSESQFGVKFVFPPDFFE